MKSKIKIFYNINSYINNLNKIYEIFYQTDMLNPSVCDYREHGLEFIHLNTI